MGSLTGLRNREAAVEARDPKLTIPLMNAAQLAPAFPAARA
jgi:hypothetical protein